MYELRSRYLRIIGIPNILINKNQEQKAKKNHHANYLKV